MPAFEIWLILRTFGHKMNWSIGYFGISVSLTLNVWLLLIDFHHWNSESFLKYLTLTVFLAVTRHCVSVLSWSILFLVCQHFFSFPFPTLRCRFFLIFLEKIYWFDWLPLAFLHRQLNIQGPIICLYVEKSVPFDVLCIQNALTVFFSRFTFYIVEHPQKMIKEIFLQ